MRLPTKFVKHLYEQEKEKFRKKLKMEENQKEEMEDD